MDHESFDRFTRLLGSAGSRRAALGVLFAAGAAGTLGAVEAAKKGRKGRKKRTRGLVSAQAVCPPPDHGVNRNNCDYENDDYSEQEIHSSSYKNTLFRNADLVGTIMHSSNYRNANFRGANLCRADLSSSNLRNADFRGFGPNQGSGRQTNLTLADLSSSSCGGIDTNGRTIFCGTIDCNGDVRNDNCPGGPPENACCSDANCGDGEGCFENECVSICEGDGTFCGACDSVQGVCIPTVEGPRLCMSGINCGTAQPCTSSAECPEGSACAGPSPITSCANVCRPFCTPSEATVAARGASSNGTIDQP